MENVQPVDWGGMAAENVGWTCWWLELSGGAHLCYLDCGMVLCISCYG